MFSSQPYEEHATISNIVKWCKTGSYGRQGPIGLILRTGLEPFQDPDMRAIAEAGAAGDSEEGSRRCRHQR